MIAKIFNYLIGRSKSDHGSDVLITSVILIPLIVIAAGFALDLTKNAYLMNAYEDMAEASVRAASNERNIYGELTQQSAHTFVREYNRQRGDDTSHISSEIQTYETAAFRSDTCNSGSAENISGIPGSGDVTFPYIRFDYNQARGGNFGTTAYMSEGGASPSVNSSNYDPTGRFVMIAHVYDVGNNFLLGMIGQQCQVFSSEVSSTAVLADRDWSE